MCNTMAINRRKKTPVVANPKLLLVKFKRRETFHHQLYCVLIISLANVLKLDTLFYLLRDYKMSIIYLETKHNLELRYSIAYIEILAQSQLAKMPILLLSLMHNKINKLVQFQWAASIERRFQPNLFHRLD